MTRRVVVLDYGSGNLRSAERALARAGGGPVGGLPVAVAVLVAVVDGVAVWVAVAVGVTVGVGGGKLPLAEPFSLTVADDLPLVASLVIAILPEKLPLLPGANSTVTVAAPCG